MGRGDAPSPARSQHRRARREVTVEAAAAPGLRERRCTPQAGLCSRRRDRQREEDDDEEEEPELSHRGGAAGQPRAERCRASVPARPCRRRSSGRPRSGDGDPGVARLPSPRPRSPRALRPVAVGGLRRHQVLPCVLQRNRGAEGEETFPCAPDPTASLRRPPPAVSGPRLGTPCPGFEHGLQ